MPGNLDVALRIRADLGNAQRGLDRFERELRQTGQAGKRSSRDLDRTARSVTRLEGSAAGAARRINGLYVALGGIGAAQIVRSLVNAGLEIEALEQRFTFAAGGIAEGRRELEFVRFEADRLGISFTAAGRGYSSLLAASRGTNISLSETREIFLGIAEASAVLRLSAAESQGALTAVEQIISKGKVSAEELRQQLGERLPGAVQIMARALGVTTQELDKMLEQGQLTSDALVDFARQLRVEYAEGVPDAADSAAAAFARLGNSIERLQQSTAESGLLDFLARAAELATGLTDALDDAFTDRPFEVAGIPAPPDEVDIVRQIEGLRDTDPIGANRILDDLTDRLLIAVGRAEELRQELDRVGDARVGGILVAEGIRDTLRTAETAIERYRQLLDAGTAALFPPPEEAAEEAEEAADIQVAAADRVTAQILALRQRLQDRTDRLGLEGIERFEQARAESLRRIAQLEEAGADPESVARARLAADVLYFRQVAQLRLEEQAQAREARDEALEGLADIERGLLGPYDRAISEVHAWRDATIAAFEEAGVSAAEYGDAVEAEFTQRLTKVFDDEAERRLEASRHWRDGAVRALEDYADAATDAAAQAARATANAFRGMEDQLVQFANTGKLSFSDFANSVIADLARIAIQQNITGPLAGIFSDFLGGGATGVPFPGLPGFGIGHSGAVIGSARRERHGVSPAVFVGARRYHQGTGPFGLRDDEVPFIGRRGEHVLTQEQMAALGRSGGPGRLTVVLRNESGRPLESEDAGERIEGDDVYREIVIRDARQNGPATQALRSAILGGA